MLSDDEAAPDPRKSDVVTYRHGGRITPGEVVARRDGRVFVFVGGEAAGERGKKRRARRERRYTAYIILAILVCHP
jgi:hypothetical protein